MAMPSAPPRDGLLRLSKSGWSFHADHARRMGPVFFVRRMTSRPASTEPFCRHAGGERCPVCIMRVNNAAEPSIKRTDEIGTTGTQAELAEDAVVIEPVSSFSEQGIFVILS